MFAVLAMLLENYWDEVDMYYHFYADIPCGSSGKGSALTDEDYEGLFD